ncbi:MAG: hypothetical protein M1826_006956 [Phylliscum demangeonii]|nr:MAG: hypothetical protein M1826_006956 [Phylliscum demangeonii]
MQWPVSPKTPSPAKKHARGGLPPGSAGSNGKANTVLNPSSPRILYLRDKLSNTGLCDRSPPRKLQSRPSGLPASRSPCRGGYSPCRTASSFPHHAERRSVDGGVAVGDKGLPHRPTAVQLLDANRLPALHSYSELVRSELDRASELAGRRNAWSSLPSRPLDPESSVDGRSERGTSDEELAPAPAALPRPGTSSVGPVYPSSDESSSRSPPKRRLVSLTLPPSKKARSPAKESTLHPSADHGLIDMGARWDELPLTNPSDSDSTSSEETVYPRGSVTSTDEDYRVPNRILHGDPACTGGIQRQDHKRKSRSRMAEEAMGGLWRAGLGPAQARLPMDWLFPPYPGAADPRLAGMPLQAHGRARRSTVSGEPPAPPPPIHSYGCAQSTQTRNRSSATQDPPRPSHDSGIMDAERGFAGGFKMMGPPGRGQSDSDDSERNQRPHSRRPEPDDRVEPRSDEEADPQPDAEGGLPSLPAFDFEHPDADRDIILPISAGRPNPGAVPPVAPHDGPSDPPRGNPEDDPDVILPIPNGPPKPGEVLPVAPNHGPSDPPLKKPEDDPDAILPIPNGPPGGAPSAGPKNGGDDQVVPGPSAPPGPSASPGPYVACSECTEPIDCSKYCKSAKAKTPSRNEAR